MMDATRAQLHDYTASGVLASSVSFESIEKRPDNVCFYYPTIKDGKWVDTLGKICGAAMPGTAVK